MTNKTLTLGSLFDGSGGFPLGGLLASITPVWASEIEPFPIRVTTKRLPFMKHYGDISQMSEVPDSLKEVYKTSFQVSPYGVIEVASRAQKWIDQALSRNMYLETRDVDELINIYTEAWKRGVKTTYYLHTKPGHSAEQSTTVVNKSQGTNKTGFANAVRQISSKSETEVQVRKIEAPAPTALAVEPVLQSVTVTVPVETKLERIRREQKAKQLATMVAEACPLDPAERALCEACQ